LKKTARLPQKNGLRRLFLIFDNHEDEQVKTYWVWLPRQADRCGFQVLAAQDAPFRIFSGFVAPCNRCCLP